LLVKFAEIIFGPLQRLGFSHKIQATALWSTLESFSAPFFSLLLIPIFTHSIGLENYGLYVMVSALVAFLSFTGLGMQVSITYYLALNHETSSPNQIAERLVSSLLISFFGTTICSCFILLGINIFVTPLNEYLPQLGTQHQLIYIALGLIVVTQLDLVVSSAIKGLQFFNVSSKVEFFLRLLSFVTVALAAINQRSVVDLVCINLIMAIFNLIVRYTMLTKVVCLNFREVKITQRITKELFHFGKWVTLQNVASAFFSSVDKLVVGSALGNTVLGTYNVLLSITQLVHFVPANVLSFIMPKVAVNSKNITVLLLKKVLTANTLFSICIATLILIFKDLIFLHFHVDSIYKPLFYWLIAIYFLLSLNVPLFFIALGVNLIKTVSLQSILGALIGTIFLLALITDYGLLAVVASKLVYAIISLFVIFPVSRKLK